MNLSLPVWTGKITWELFPLSLSLTESAKWPQMNRLWGKVEKDREQCHIVWSSGHDNTQCERDYGSDLPVTLGNRTSQTTQFSTGWYHLVSDTKCHQTRTGNNITFKSNSPFPVTVSQMWDCLGNGNATEASLERKTEAKIFLQFLLFEWNSIPPWKAIYIFWTLFQGYEKMPEHECQVNVEPRTQNKMAKARVTDSCGTMNRKKWQFPIWCFDLIFWTYYQFLDLICCLLGTCRLTYSNWPERDWNYGTSKDSRQRPDLLRTSLGIQLKCLKTACLRIFQYD